MLLSVCTFACNHQSLSQFGSQQAAQHAQALAAKNKQEVHEKQQAWDLIHPKTVKSGPAPSSGADADDEDDRPKQKKQKVQLCDGM
jgi:hypothetical protein